MNRLPYPWSDMEPGLLRVIAKAGPEGAYQAGRDYMAKRHPGYEDGWEDEWLHQAKRTLRTVSAWLRGNKKLIRLSGAAVSTLVQVPPRWLDLPKPGSPLYGDGVMFVPEDDSNLVFFGAPLGDPIAPRLAVAVWAKVPHPKHPAGEAWGVLQLPGIVDKTWVERSDLSARKIGKATASLVHIAVNAFAAMEAEYINPIVQRRNPGRRRSSKIAGIRGCKSLRLDDNALCVWRNRLITFGEPKPGRGPDEQPRKRPSQYTVDDFRRRQWVSTPKPGEEIAGQKEGKRGTLYAVWRRVQGSTRGGPVVPKEIRLHTGVGDLRL